MVAMLAMPRLPQPTAIDWPGLTLAAHFGTLEFLRNRGRNVSKVHGLELLPHVDHARQRHVQPAGDVDLDPVLDHLFSLYAG